MIKILFLILSVFLFSSCGLNEDRESATRAFFGDKENDRVVIVDVEDMKLNPYVYTGHASTYTADEIYGLNKTYVVNRGENFIDVLNIYSMKITKSIELEHFPRSSEAINMSLGLAEASGMDKAMASIIDIYSDEVISVVGLNEEVNIDTDEVHGGSHATGHPFWFDKNHFALLDRSNSKVVTYHITKLQNGDWKSTILNTLDTTTSIHQIIPNKRGYYQGKANTFYLVAEGSDSEFPSIIEVKFSPSIGLTKTDEISLEYPGAIKAEMFIHHGDFHPNEPLIYVGSDAGKDLEKGSGKGKLFIINYENMTIIDDPINVGRKAGHACMIPPANKAVVINHSDDFVSIINTLTNKWVADVNIRKPGATNTANQAHMNYHFSDDGRYFYAFVTSDGIMYELDLENLEVSRTVDVGGQPAQGSFITVLVD